MNKVFRSKIGLIVLIPSILALAFPFFVVPLSWLTLLFLGLVIPFVLPPLLGTYYKIDNNVLLIKCGFFFRWDIDISSIVSIKKTRNPISSPALSLDRLEISFDNGSETVIISPKNKQDFIQTIKSLNSKVLVLGI